MDSHGHAFRCQFPGNSKILAGGVVDGQVIPTPPDVNRIGQGKAGDRVAVRFGLVGQAGLFQAIEPAPLGGAEILFGPRR